ncbi:MAG: PAS domain-containing protein [Chloroflexaceae bacterium]|jgi:PAS domain S-box-containing protein|nr:PAS domain-containing protein [Chloroflexaceae bacterium]
MQTTSIDQHVQSDVQALQRRVAELEAQVARQQQELAQRTSEERLRFILESSDDGLWDWNVASGEQFTSPNWSRMLGYEPGELHPSVNTWLQLCHPDDLAEAHRRMEIHFAGATPVYEHEHRLRHKSGRRVWVLGRAKVVQRDEQGTPLRVVGTNVDISARKAVELQIYQLTADLEARVRERTLALEQANLALQASQKYLQHIADLSPVVIYVLDLVEQRTIYVNREVGEALGYTPADIQGMGPNFLSRMVHPDDQARAADRVAHLVSLGEGRYAEWEYRMGHADGSWHWFYGRETIFARDNQGEPTQVLGIAYDIDDRKQSELALRESEARLQLVLQHMPVMLNAVGPDGTFLAWNAECERVTGYSAETILNHPNAVELLYPDVDYRTAMVAEWSVRGGSFRDWELQLTASDGSSRLVSWSNLADAVPIPGWVSWAVGVDVTARKRMEDALRDSQHFLERITQQTPAMIYVFDLEQGRNIYANRQMGQILGYSHEEAQQFSTAQIAEFMHPDDAARIPDNFARILALADGEVFEVEYRVRDAHGQWRWFFGRDSVFARDAEGRVNQFLGTIIDITERKEAEAERARQTRLALLRAEVNEAINRSEPLPAVLHACAEAVVQHLDAAFARIWLLHGKMLNLVASAGCYTHLDGAHSCIALGQFKIGRIAQRGQPHYTNDVLHDREIGDKDWAQQEGMVAFAGYPLLVGERVIGVLALFARQQLPPTTLDSLASVCVVIAQGLERLRTETALREREQQISQLNEELEERVRLRTAALQVANKELESFSYSVSHDLRAPLRAIDGFSRAMLEDYGAQLDSQGQHYLQRICAGTGRMGQLIDDLLNLARVSRADMRNNEVNLSQLAGQVCVELQQQHPGRHVEVEIMPNMVARGDEYLLRLVLENLLSNAWKFTSHHPQARISFTAHEHDKGLVYTVRDDGAGFDMAYADKLFGAFQRLHSLHQFPGTGIGLATVQRIIHRHGGRIWAEGAVEQGAIFSFTLPRLGSAER